MGLGNLGLEDVRRKDSGTLDVGNRGRDKLTAPDFLAEFVKLNFRYSQER